LDCSAYLFSFSYFQSLSCVATLPRQMRYPQSALCSRIANSEILLFLRELFFRGSLIVENRDSH
jgi:hypothetical protein